MPTFPLGHHAHLQRLNNAQRIARLEPTKPVIHIHRGFEFPDPVDIRGIPAVGRSVGGAIRGTRPDLAIENA